jgi:RNA polymerase sigma-70 factor, ECF subfamily
VTDQTDNQKVEGFIRLLTANQDRIYAYILSLVADFPDADDIMQEVTTVMWRKYDSFETGSDFAAWGMAIARYKVMNHRKQQKGRPVYLNDDSIQALEDDLKNMLKSQDERLDALKRCIKKLSGVDGKLVRMRYYEDVSAQDIAARMGKHVRTIYKLFARIQARLLGCVRQTMGGNNQ